MLTGRRTKLAIAVAILIVGIGAAFLFRREEPAHTPAVSKKPASPVAAEQSSRKPNTRNLAATEPSLTGHIEPYGWKDGPSGVGNQTRSDQPATTAPENDSKPSSMASRSASDRDRTTAEQPASYASPSSQHKFPEASSTRPPFDIPAESNPAVLNERNATLFDRFATRPPSSGAPAAGKRHKIIDGDTLTSIAKRYLGTEERYRDLFEHNRDVLTNPELLPIGKELRIPPANYVRAAEPPSQSQSSTLTAVAPVAAAPRDTHRMPEPRSARPPLAATNPAAQETYVVQAHDTLGLIARKVYGDIARQAELLAANRQQLRTPQDLRPGMTLIVPAARKPE